MKVCVVTGTRAEYGLLYWLLKEIVADTALELQLIVTGMHLSTEFGLTYKEIEKEFTIDKKIEIILSSDSAISVSKSMGLAQISFSEAYEELQPDILILLGDRYEIFSAASVAMIARIPIAHIHGGEATFGLIDEPIRHSITKMSHLHFTATQEYRQRVIQLGEAPKRVFNIGGMGIENIKRITLLSKQELQEILNFNFKTKNLLITFHPVTLENTTAKEQFYELLDALDSLEDTGIIFTKANSDMGGRVINEMIDNYINTHKNAIAFASMGQRNYLSTLQFIDGVVGNSSSGLLEAPSFQIGTIDIGDRQKGRIKAKSVLECSPKREHITKCIDKIYTKEFQKRLKNIKNPYEAKTIPSKEIIKVLKQTDLHNIIKKRFYDLEVKSL
jgi:GDP/UDP-N,N'-diacetylbacillosamine 2-epimerase (hydrolysing)